MNISQITKENPTWSLNMAVSIALGCNRFIHEDIDGIYEENRFEYYDAYLRSDSYQNKSLTKYLIETEDKIKKVAGISEWCFENNDFVIMRKLIKKGYNFTYRFFEQNKAPRLVKDEPLSQLVGIKKSIIDFRDFAKAIAKRINFETANSLLLYNQIVMKYLCALEEVEFKMDTRSEMLFERMLVGDLLSHEIKSIKFSDERLVERRAEVDAMLDEFGIDRKKKVFTVHMIILSIADKLSGKVLSSTNTSREFEKWLDTNKHGLLKYIGAYTGLIKTLGLGGSDVLERSEITIEEIELIFLNYLVMVDEINYSETDKHQFVISALFLHAVVSNYQKAKELFFNTKEEEHYVELKELKTSLIEKEEQLKREQKEFEDERSRFELERSRFELEKDRLMNKTVQLESENKVLKQELERAVDNSKELIALRDFINELQMDDEEEAFVEYNQNERMSEYLSTLRIGIIGGHTTWIKKVKEKFPNFVFVNQDRLGADLNYLRHLDVVCINTKTFNHAFYRKAMVHIDKGDTKLFYINENYNLDILIPKFYKNCKKLLG